MPPPLERHFHESSVHRGDDGRRGRRGSEIVAAAVLDPGILAIARPVGVGDAERLRQALAIVQLQADVHRVETVGDAVFDGTPRINVIDLGLLPADLPWGQLSAVAGDAAFHYVRVAAELAMSGDVQAICTA